MNQVCQVFPTHTFSSNKLLAVTVGCLEELVEQRAHPGQQEGSPRFLSRPQHCGHLLCPHMSRLRVAAPEPPPFCGHFLPEFSGFAILLCPCSHTRGTDISSTWDNTGIVASLSKWCRLTISVRPSFVQHSGMSSSLTSSILKRSWKGGNSYKWPFAKFHKFSKKL